MKPVQEGRAPVSYQALSLLLSTMRTLAPRPMLVVRVARAAVADGGVKIAH